MKSIYKFPLSVGDESEINMPSGSEILTVQVQDNKICIWAKVDLGSTTLQVRTFRVVGTGHPFDPKLTYIGTVLIGLFVWHIFEVPIQ